ncbi:uncharacterized protein CEXT_38401 [Caerostris extrusa]|uniref:Secreted protein n=1 Tax=Caerostris extrusa TaxID=172846 RepID=A0AAV4TUT7_CAEEX|nr:uncharacterized protein CEXT_38401 [Caerostris extrusa]
MNVIYVVLLGLIPALGYAYEMVIKHDPWWAYELDGNSIESSYQFYHPYYKQQQNYNQPKKNRFQWYPSSSVDFNKIPMPKMPPIPSVPNKPRKMSAQRWREMNAREWPEWIPPIRMIKLPLDEPPAF